eukprot:GGOE01044470.1.p1 GENE.GGOE01044470.1~~GGOE01044470.1.p1  ORF type:complete len:457 (-),score=115.79 GGOE01044470.1:226-1596(-)
MAARPKVIVLDDDPTGSQTVHSCLLLTRWDVPTLCTALSDPSPIFFVLTNTRALTAEAAAAVTREVCLNLKQALAALPDVPQWLAVSRSDSTLRGHYPVETDVITEVLGPFDAHFLTPAFFPGGRKTIDSVHYLHVDGVDTPVHLTEFARDSVFGYHHSFLPRYVEEKTAGRIKADDVGRFLLEDIRRGWCRERLLGLHGNQCCTVDSERQEDMDIFANDVLAAAARGKRFLFRSAASLLTSLAALGDQPVPQDQMHTLVRNRCPGVVVCGSHVRLSTQQLERLLAEPMVKGVEVDVTLLRQIGGEVQGQVVSQAVRHVQAALSGGCTAVVYTTRKEEVCDDARTRLAFGDRVSAALMAIVRELPRDVGFLVAKGGITSNDVLKAGLGLATCRIVGQILAGCSVVQTPPDHPLYPGLPVVIFPGNVGGPDGLCLVHQRLAHPPPADSEETAHRPSP